jgi:serine/threonine-protein kinase RsbT
VPDQSLPVRESVDVVSVRQAVRRAAADLGFSLVDQTKLVTATSELARNMVDYGGGGVTRIERLEAPRPGLRIAFEDQGPGIPDVALALSPGYTTGRGLGLGLGGAKKLVHEFEVRSEPGKGTLVTITRWR